MSVTLFGLLKPCYVFRPSALFRRIGLALSGPKQPGMVDIELPWGDVITANSGDAIGCALQTQGIFDIAVSECAWRLLDSGSRVIDAGANIGYMSLLFAHKAGAKGEVHAFEPHPRICETLQGNLDRFLNKRGSKNIHIYDYALGSEEALCHLEEPADFALNQGTASIAPSEATSRPKHTTGNSHLVTVKPLDSIFQQGFIDLLKIDVEGHEKQVIAGASHLLREGRVRHIIYEDHDKERSGLHETLTAFGYQVFSIGYTFFGPLLLPWNHQIAIHESWESASFLATLGPEECLKRLRKRGWRVLRGDFT